MGCFAYEALDNCLNSLMVESALPKKPKLSLPFCFCDNEAQAL